MSGTLSLATRPAGTPLMKKTNITCPATRSQVVDLYFMEHRAKVIDIAAFLDRYDRSTPDAISDEDDFRIEAFRAALRIVQDGKPHRARRVLESFSDMTAAPVSAAGMKGALGAVAPKSSRSTAAAKRTNVVKKQSAKRGRR